MDPNPIDSFVALAKGTSGKGLEALITQALDHPSLFTFGELLDVPNVAEVVRSGAPHGKMLELFAYGTCADYASASAQLGALSAAQKRKLQTLTVVSLCAKRKVVPYADMLAAVAPLGPIDATELEDVLLEAIYANLIVGKMDQEHQCFEVVWCQARDVRPEDLGALIAGLGAWKDATASAAQLLLAQQEGCKLKAEAFQAEQAALEKDLKDAKERQREEEKDAKVQRRRGGGGGGW